MLPLAAPGYFFKAHDGSHSVSYLVEFDQAIRDGLIADLGAGLCGGFRLSGLVGVRALGILRSGNFPFAGFRAHGCGQAHLGVGLSAGRCGDVSPGAALVGTCCRLIAALAYTYAPYHLVQIYVRGALAEFLALAWFPWVLLAFVELWDDPRPRRVAWAALALAP